MKLVSMICKTLVLDTNRSNLLCMKLFPNDEIPRVVRVPVHASERSAERRKCPMLESHEVPNASCPMQMQSQLQ